MRDAITWPDLPAAQQPPWPDQVELEAALDELSTLPPLVFAGECDVLATRLSEAAQGRAFVLMGGDCAETFAGNNADSIRARLKTVLQMSVILTYAASLPGDQGRPDGGPVLQAALAAASRPAEESSSRRTSVTRSTRWRSRLRAVVRTRSGSSAPTTRRARHSTWCAPSPRAATPTCARCTRGTRTSSVTRLPVSGTRPWRPTSIARCPSCTPSVLTRRNCSGWSSTPRTRRCPSTTSGR